MKILAVTDFEKFTVHSVDVGIGETGETWEEKTRLGSYGRGEISRFTDAGNALTFAVDVDGLQEPELSVRLLTLTGLTHTCAIKQDSLLDTQHPPLSGPLSTTTVCVKIPCDLEGSLISVPINETVAALTISWTRKVELPDDLGGQQSPKEQNLTRPPTGPPKSAIDHLIAVFLAHLIHPRSITRTDSETWNFLIQALPIRDILADLSTIDALASQPDLSVPSRVRLIRGIVGNFSADLNSLESSLSIQRLIIGTPVRDLDQLRANLEKGDGGLVRVVFDAVKDKKCREEILNKFREAMPLAQTTHQQTSNDLIPDDVPTAPCTPVHCAAIATHVILDYRGSLE